MDARELRGKEIAEKMRIRRNSSGLWLVPSQSGRGDYSVSLENVDAPTCTCPDFEERNKPCKHVFAVAYFVVAQKNPDGSTTVTETVTVTSQRKTYPQKWPQYNAAQTSEGDKFQELLRDLCAGIEEPVVEGRGRPPLPLSDAIFSAAFKVYSTMSGRRFMSDLREAHRRGMVSRVVHYNSIFRYLEDDGLTPIVRDLIRQSSIPLKAVETDFAVDSSGFSTNRFTRWYDYKFRRMREKADWVKAHIICGVRTNVITDIEIGDKNAGDSPFFAPLVKTTAKAFTISEVSADKAYSGETNISTVAGVNGTAFIPFRTNTKGEKGSALWKQMFHYFMFKRDEFLQHYHKRSNVESTFSMLKRKFGDSLRSKSDTAMINETLCKVLCHNLVVLIHEIHELGIDPVFWQSNTASA
jgi:transposase